jgi:predicted outer membrane repeat protein
MILSALFGLATSFVFVAAEGATVSVCRAGCDFSTVAEAMDAAAPGDTIRVLSGIYSERLVVEKDLTIEGEDPEETVLDGSDQGTVITVARGVTVEISGVTVTHGAGSAGGSTNDAGGIHNLGTLTLRSSVVAENTAPEDPSGTGKGGGIRNDGDLELFDCRLSGNTAAGRGGGAFNTGTLLVRESTLCANTASGGGGIFNEGQLEVSASTFVDNRATEDGGAILTEGTCVLVNSTVSANHAERNGGGLAVRPGSMPVAPTSLIHSTIADNDALNRQGGAGVYNESSTPVTLEGTIIAGNQGSRNCSGETRSEGYNIDGDGSCGLDPDGERPDQPGTDPLLEQLGFHGGRTLTHALEVGSPAIDAAAEAPSCPVSEDQRGAPRPVGARCDIGAYERPACDPAPVSVDFTRGDADQNAETNLTDAVYILQFLFLGGPQLECADAGDTDDDGRLVLTDAVFLLNWLFQGGPPPPEPGACGPDFTPDGLSCEAAPACPGEAPRYWDLWTSAAEIGLKPMAGPAWDAVWQAAQDACPAEATVANQDSNSNVQILGAALASLRLREEDPETARWLRRKVIGAIENLVRAGDPGEAIGCPAGCGKAVNETLAWGRQAGAYVLAADLVGYRTRAIEDWLRNLAEVWVACDGRTLLDAFEQRPNNWGMMSFGSLVALYAYLGDTERLEYVRSYFVAGLAGEIPDCEDAAGGEPCYIWGGGRDPGDKDMTWHCDPATPSLIAPDCTVTVGEIEVDFNGLIPDDQRRGCSFCPPQASSEFCGAISEDDRCIRPEPDSHITDWMTGAILGARILDRVGMPVWESADQALKRMLIAHMVTHCQLTCDDDGFQCESLYNCKDWIVPVVDEAYGLSAELDPPPPTDCECPFELAGRGTGASKNAGFGAFIVP